MNFSRYNIFGVVVRGLHVLSVIMVLIALFSVETRAFESSVYTDSSALSAGKWVKIKVEADGIYRITRSDIVRWGFSSSDWDNVRVFGYGGTPIPDALTLSNYIDDLPQLPVWKSANEILFFGKGTSSTNTSVGSHSIIEVQHPYATAGYYFVTVDSEIPQKEPEISTVQNLPISLSESFTECLHQEQETTSPGKTGRLLIGEDFKYTSSRTFRFDLKGLVPETQISIRTQFMSKILGSTGELRFSYNGTQLSQVAGSSISQVMDAEHEHCVSSAPIYTLTPDGERLDWKIDFSSNGNVVVAALDYISVNYRRKLELGSEPLIFTGNASGYAVTNSSGAGNVIIADITNPSQPKQMNVTGDDVLRFAAMYTGNRRYIAFPAGENQRYSAPSYEGNVANQNIHGETVPDMVIITPQEYKAQALRLAALHEQKDSLHTLVLTQNEVFNEFSSGTPDLNAVRRMLKMFYDRGANSGGRTLKYLALFGRGTYDNRELSSAVKNARFPKVLTWQSVNGLNENDSYCTDDIYAMLEDGAGAVIARDKSCIGVGRFPIKSVSEAKTAVDKIESYMSNSNLGAWKNNILTIADDEDQADHMIQADSVISKLKQSPASSGFIFNRIYIDAFPAISNGTSRTYPDARKRMFERFSEGTLWASYIGHANPQSWTHDGLLNIQDINTRFYYKNLPFLFTATCEFTRWDADDVSGGELLFLNSSGGTIAMISTTRLALIHENGVFSSYLALQVLRKVGCEFQRVGDIFKNTKNSFPYGNGNKLRYTLVGDPALRLTYPTYNIKIESINGVAVSDDYPVIKGGGEVEVTGSIYNGDGEPATDFSGTIVPRLYDAETSVETFGYGKNGEKHLYYEYSNLLYLGEDSVRNGKFAVKFKMPQDISNNYSPALLNMYASSSSGAEANGSTNRFYVYGYEEDAVADTIPPVIEAFGLNAMSNPEGVFTVNESPLVMASFYDDSGINLSTAGIGHQMTLLLDGITLYDDVVYQYSPAIGKNGGTIAYRLNDLTKGTHTLRLKVWDVANNSSESNITFNVQPGLAPELVDVYTTNSPASVEAKFYLKHNLPDAQVNVTIEVFNMLGRPVWSATASGKSDSFTSMPVVWNLTDNAGRRVPRGIYIYRASVSTEGGAVSNTKSKKIAVTAP